MFDTFTPLQWLACFCTTALVGTWVKGRIVTRDYPLPPGPPGHWFWGNAMPRSQIAYQFARWVDEYGPVVSLRPRNKVIIIIGRYEAACDLMEKEGGALADRPRLIAAGEIFSRNMRLLLTRYGEQFKRLRKAAHTHLQPKAVVAYEPLQMHNAKNVILDILDNPALHMMHARRYSASAMMKITYGKSTPTDMTDPEMARVLKCMHQFQAAMRPGRYLVDTFPFLKYVPGYGGDLERWRKDELALFGGLMNRVKTNMDNDKAEACFMRYLIEHVDDHQLSSEEMTYLGGTFFGAGFDTTTVAIIVQIMAAACHPEEQAKVQEELDMVVGHDRAPTFSDQDMLPQLHAFTLEALRWRPVTPIGFAHRATKDIIWKGYCIPEGATVFGNHWAITRDPSVFPDPEKFDPGRWINSEGKVRTDIHSFTFGFGRRVCPGQHLANRSIFINTSLLFWSFRISQNPLAPIDTMSFDNGVVTHPQQFDAIFEPRMNKAVLKQMMENYAKD
ncbi:hypothetical protein SERLA73DRAFT_190373 [Serpula lacrymans var. lacrymans S7.3]|uniref:Cytochrome P450 n=2 Tax=Serpula lacrymans var. lacrymans TaxID=341189 RepID=F8QFK1_SERL3|nr:uncharacterized protein SERLADRAFT_479424 [Serpula lacrymans var. lacrymans S7.9]EGN92985.1 hypothetical protein SERLA73DRAFT_190373 [Serpula lacrymans var. lacrymans S7.3]EGO19697.1 hypothetical protein SERLADRAFT_479424 [Serpula lacrymans var. lacrymans S7.9]